MAETGRPIPGRPGRDCELGAPRGRPQAAPEVSRHNQAVRGFVDIHSHVLPGIDDGPPDVAGALDMARAASDAGTRVLAATPHLRSDFPDVHIHELAERCEALRRAIALAGIDLELVSGAEVSLVWALEAAPDELVLASYGGRGMDLLIESPEVSVSGLGAMLHELGVQGFRITLAHPERSPAFQRDPGMLERITGQGVLLQVNAASLLEDGRRQPASRLGRELCRRGLAHALASDGHRAESWRPVTNVSRVAGALRGEVGDERFEWLTATAPAAIIAGTKVPEPPPARSKHRRWRLGRV